MKARRNKLRFESLEPRAMLAGLHFDFTGDTNTPARTALTAAAMIADNPNYIAIVGDLNYGSLSAAGYDTAIGNQFKSYISSSNFFPAIGNHDAPDAAYLAYFNLPTSIQGGERYYSVVRGDTKLIVCDTENGGGGLSPTSTQGLWLKQEVGNSTSKNIIVIFHRPMYSNGSHGSTAGVQWINGLTVNGRTVTLAVTGHDHDYERVIVGGHTSIVVGTGGFKTVGYPLSGSLPGLQYETNQYLGYLRVTETTVGLHGEFVGLVNGTPTVLDSFDVTGNGSSVPPPPPPQPPPPDPPPVPNPNPPPVAVGKVSVFNANKVAEGADLLYVVKLGTAATSQVTVHFTTRANTAGVNAAATPDVDFVSASGNLTFAAGESVKTVTVHTKTDSLTEPDERLDLVLSSPVGVIIGDGRATGDISDSSVISPPPPPPPPPPSNLTIVHEQFRVTNPGNGIVIDAAGKQYIALEDTQFKTAPAVWPSLPAHHGPGESSNGELYPFTIRGTSVNVTVKNVNVTSAITPDVPWDIIKSIGDGDGIRTEGEGVFTVNGARVDNVEDGLSPHTVGNGTFHYTNIYTTRIHDDMIEDDDSVSGEIDHGVFEGHTFFSERGGSGAVGRGPSLVYIHDVAAKLVAMPQTIAKDQQIGYLFKMDSSRHDLIHMVNSVLWVDRIPNQGKSALDIPPGTYEGVTIVWTGSGAYPGKLQPGVTVTTNPAAYTAARDAIFASQNFNALAFSLTIAESIKPIAKIGLF